VLTIDLPPEFHEFVRGTRSIWQCYDFRRCCEGDAFPFHLGPEHIFCGTRDTGGRAIEVHVCGYGFVIYLKKYEFIHRIVGSCEHIDNHAEARWTCENFVVKAVIANPEVCATDGHPRNPVAEHAPICTYHVRPTEVPDGVGDISSIIVHYAV
jgi:hypothetical protein